MNRKGIVFIMSFFGLSGLYSQTVKDSSFQTYDQQIGGTSIKFKMVAIAPGSFAWKSSSRDKTTTDNEMQVKLDAFWIEEHEVTYDEYILFADEAADAEPKPDGITRPSPPYIDFTLGMGKSGGFPANSMSQYAAIMYCKWLYKKTGIFFRLPSEAEWEYACRAGRKPSDEIDKEKNVLKDVVWFNGNSENRYHKVMQLKPNAWGLYDMQGNVAEWTLDVFTESYADQLKRNAVNPVFIPLKKYPVTIKGGSYRDEAGDTRCGSRIPSDPKWNARDPQIPRSKWWNTDAPFLGFRIVRPRNQPSPEEAETFFSTFLSLK